MAANEWRRMCRRAGGDLARHIREIEQERDADRGARAEILGHELRALYRLRDEWSARLSVEIDRIGDDAREAERFASAFERVDLARRDAIERAIERAAKEREENRAHDRALGRGGPPP